MFNQNQNVPQIPAEQYGRFVGGLIVLAIYIFPVFIGTFLGPFFPLYAGGIYWLKTDRRKYPLKSALVATGVELVVMVLYAAGAKQLFIYMVWANIIGGVFILMRSQPMEAEVLRGTSLTTAKGLQKFLARREAKEIKERGLQPVYPQIQIGGITLPNYLENLSFFFVGSPGSGKTQSILQVLHTLRMRPDWRVICLDRNGELLEQLYQQSDIIFNPKDTRSVGWSHVSENANFETIAAGLIPDNPNEKDPFWSNAARNLISDLYDRTFSNSEVWEVLTTFKMEEIKDFLAGTISARYFEGESGNTAGSVVGTAISNLRFYRDLKKCSTDAAFSFSKWGKNDDPRWVFLPLFEDDSEIFKPLFTTAFELMLRGLLSNEGRKMKTALVIDELGAVGQLRSLPRMLSESRKFGGSAFLGTQTTAQIQEVYGDRVSQILLQGTCTKLILNLRDPDTAEQFAKLIGQQERVDITSGSSNSYSSSGQQSSSSANQQIRETYAVLPSQLQNLPRLEGYLTIADGSPPARVQVTPQSFGRKADRFIPITPVEV
jgi:hypothetical protein